MWIVTVIVLTFGLNADPMSRDSKFDIHETPIETYVGRVVGSPTCNAMTSVTRHTIRTIICEDSSKRF